MLVGGSVSDSCPNTGRAVPVPVCQRLSVIFHGVKAESGFKQRNVRGQTIIQMNKSIMIAFQALSAREIFLGRESLSLTPAWYLETKASEPGLNATGEGRATDKTVKACLVNVSWEWCQCTSSF